MLELEKATVLYCFISSPWNFSKHKISFKNKNPKIWDHSCLNGYFELEFQKTIVVFEISILEFIYMQSFIQKQKKTSNLGPKIPYLGIFVLQFNKSYYKAFNQNVRICEIIEFHPKQKKINLRLKILYLGIWAGLLKKYFHIWNQRPPISLISIFFCKNGNSHIRDQKCLIWVFLGWKLPEILSYLISASSNLSCCKNKILKFGTKSAWFGYLGSGSWKYYCHIWNQHPRICLIAKFSEKKKCLNV